MPITFITYYIVPFKFKNAVCLAASLVFYAWGDPIYIFLMVASIIMNYVFGVLLGKTEHKRRRKLLLALTVVANIGALGVFKYAGFFVESISYLFDWNLPVPQIRLPLGISFYTFQAMSYVIDVYRKDAKPQNNLFKVALYVTAFPQLVAGPIVRYTTVMDQIEYREISLNKVAEGIFRFVIGLAKKVLLANTLGSIADQIFAIANVELSVGTAWLGIISYALQIYFDFSGYSDMGIGMGKMLGFDFEENFNYPYVSVSITDFWRRWHMSLGTWFRDYLYIPLGGSRKGTLIQIRNILIVWATTGLWHGADWTFVLWGLYYGCLLIVEKLSNRILARIPVSIRWATTMLLVLVGWVFFRAGSIQQAIQYLSKLVGIRNSWTDQQFNLMLHDNWYIILAACIGATAVVKSTAMKLISKFRMEKYPTWLIRATVVCCLLFLCTIFLVNSTYNPFIYFRF